MCEVSTTSPLFVYVYKKTKAFLKVYTFLKVELKDLITSLLC